MPTVLLSQFDLPAADTEGGQIILLQGVDEVRLALPQADVLDVRTRRSCRSRHVRVENGELVPVVLGVPDLGIVELQLEAVRRRCRVAPRFVAFGAAVSQQHEAAGLVRRLALRVLDERGADVRRNHHQTVRSIACSTSSASQKSADRYFQPASAKTATTTPSSSSPASLRATCPTAPAETPAKIPSSSSRRRTSRTESSFETSSLRSSFETSRIGGT